MKNTSLIWFRNNLRIHDNEVLSEAIQNSKSVLPLYCFDPRNFGELKITKLPKTGYFRCKFLLESIKDLRSNLEELGSKLLVEKDAPEIIIKKLKQKYPQINTIYSQKEFASEETEIEEAVKRICNELGVELKLFDTNSLYRHQDLPFEIDKLPDVFTNFRNKVERKSSVRSLVETQKQFTTVEVDEWGEIPSTDALIGKDNIQDDPQRFAIKFEGGESQGLKRLKYYIWESHRVKTYKKTRNRLLGPDYSTKFSAWLANGCLSPVQIYWEIKKYEKEHGSNESTYWVIFELLWREYFRLSAQKYGSKIFQKGGIQGYPGDEKQNLKFFEQWKLGRTEEKFVNANMIELLETGFMSNRGRQNVASFLVHNLKLDWRMGAEWFESQLIDYDVYSNWGNWCYVAGVGHDPRNRKFNIQRQADMYDPQRQYIDYWLNEENRDGYQTSLLL